MLQLSVHIMYFDRYVFEFPYPVILYNSLQDLQMNTWYLIDLPSVSVLDKDTENFTVYALKKEFIDRISNSKRQSDEWCMHV